MASFTDKDRVVGDKKQVPGACSFQLVKKNIIINVVESKAEVKWQIVDGLTLLSHGLGQHWQSAKYKIAEQLDTIELDPLIRDQLRFDIGARPSELEIQETLSGLEPAPENELVAYNLSLGYSAMGARPVDGTWIKKGADGIYEARMPMAIMGSGGGYGDPFRDMYDGNYVTGRANSREGAIKIMILESARIAASLWE